MFQQAYDSTWHHPVLFWVLGAPWLIVFVLRALRRPDFLRVALALFQAEILLDAWLTSPWSPMPNSAVIGTVFVVLGDLRYFVLLERFGVSAEARRWAPRAIALSLLVPVLTFPANWLWPGRPLFLTYELAFAGLASIIRFVVLRRRTLSQPVHTWLERLTLFELAVYLGWASADVIILGGA